MAYSSCNGTLAANIALECSTPLEGGYTGRAVAIPYSVAPTLSVDASNPRILKTVSVGSDANVVVIDNVYQSPFAGSTSAANADAGRTRYPKTLVVHIPVRGADMSKDLVEPLINSAEGFLLIVEKRDHRGLGSYEVIGLQSPAKIDPTTVTRNEAENGGAIQATFACTEDWFECNFYSTDYAATKTAFEALLALGF